MMRTLKICTIIGYICVLYTGGFAFQVDLMKQSDTLAVRKWTIDDGLPVNTLNTMVQDQVGYLWFSTYDGLVRFDGAEFKIYNHANTPVMPHNRITHLYYQDGVGMWVSLEYGGVLLYKDGEFKHFGPEEGFTDSDIRTVKELSGERMIFITNKGLYQFKKGTFSQPFDLKCIHNDQVINIYEDYDGSLWVSGRGCLIQLRDGQVTNTYLNDYPELNLVYSVNRSAEGVLYAGTNQGLFSFQDGDFRRPDNMPDLLQWPVLHIFDAGKYLVLGTDVGLFCMKEGNFEVLQSSDVSFKNIYAKISKDSDGRYWLISEGGELVIFEDGRISDLEAVSELEGISYNNFFEDREGNKWLLTTRSGLVRLDESKVRTIGEPEGLSGGNILALLEDSKGRFWVGTRGDGLNMIEGDNLTHYEEKVDMASSIIQSLIEDDEGNIWVGHFQKGIDRLDENGNMTGHYDLSPNPEGNDIRGMYIDEQERFWVATYQGLVWFDPVNREHRYYNRSDGMDGVKVRYITSDSSGTLWIGTLDGGISSFKDGTFTNYGLEAGLSSENVRSLHVDEDETGTLWIGTENNGLNRFRDGNFKYLSVEDGLPDYNIHWISEDKNNWLWMSSNKGIFKIHKADLNDYLDGKANDYRIITFGSPEGMRNPEGNGSFQEAGIRTSAGTFWFSTQEGVAIIDSEHSGFSSYDPPTIIEGVVVGNQFINSDSVVIEPEIEGFRVQYQTLSFSNIHKTRYRYRLNPNEEWIENGFEREAFISGLSPGNYEFAVQSTDNQGAWSPDHATLSIIVQPSFYQEAWFYLLLVLVLGLGYYATSKVRYRYLMNKQSRLKKVIEEQTAELRMEKNEIKKQNEIIEKQSRSLREMNQAKDKFFSIIAHDLRNPFQAMLGYSELLLSDFESLDADELKQSLEDIRDSSKSLHSLVENLLSWASLQTGKMTPAPEVFKLDLLLEKNVSLFSQLARQKEIDIETNIEPDSEIKADRHMIDAVIRNLISNAIKFTEKGGQVHVQLEMSKRNALITIQDNGIGMSREMIKNTMKLDANISRLGTNNEEGTGLGLIISKEMLGMHGGRIDIKSEEGEGSTFKVTLPKNLKNESHD